MFSSSCPLGTAIYYHQGHNIELRVAGSAHITSSSGSSFNLDEPKLFGAINSRDFWVSSLPSLQIRLCIKIHGHSQTGKQTEIFYNDMAEILGRAQLWSDLHFVVASQIYDVPSHKPDISQMNIVLRLQQSSSRLLGSKPTKLPSALSALFDTSGDIHPPPEIPKVVIREVDITLDFCSAAPPDPHIWPIANNITPQEVANHDDEDFLLTEIPIWPQEVGPWGVTRCDYLQSPNPEIFDSRSDYDGTWESLDDDSPFSSQQSHISDASTAPDPKIWTSTIDRFASISLLDTGIRSLFSSNCFPTHPEVKCRGETELTCLADLAPSIFDPGYRTAISQRANFIPSIARAITSLLSNTDSPHIKSKLQDLESSFRDTHLHLNENEESHSTIDANGVIKCLLWKTMQRGLYDPKRGPKLSPLDTNTTFTQGKDTTLFTPMDDDDDDDDDDDGGANFDRSTQWDVVDDFNYGNNSENPDGDILADNPYPDVPVSLSCMVDSLSDVNSESSLIFCDTDAFPLPDLIVSSFERPRSVHDDTEVLEEKGTPQLLDCGMEDEMLDCSSPAQTGSDQALPRGISGDSEMLL